MTRNGSRKAADVDDDHVCILRKIWLRCKPLPFIRITFHVHRKCVPIAFINFALILRISDQNFTITTR